MSLASSPGVPTHSRYNTLDLVWSNTGAIADVRLELNSTSDHTTIVGNVPRPNASGSSANRLNNPSRITSDALEDFEEIVSE